MPRRTRATARVIGLIAAASPLLISTLGSAAVSNSSPWTPLSSGSVGTTLETPSIAAFGTGYQVIWVKKSASNSFSIQSRLLSGSGKPLGGVITVLSGWSGIQADPTLTGLNVSRQVLFGGTKTGVPADNTGAEYTIGSVDGGKTWIDQGQATASADDGADHSNGTAVTYGAKGPITAIANGGQVDFHVGISAENPAPGVDPHTVPTGSGTEEPGLGTDAKTGAVWAVWFAGGSSLGVHAQEIYPTLAAHALKAPGDTNSSGAHDPNQDLSVAARLGGGLYTAYPSPTGFAAVVWKIGARKPAASIKTATGVENVIVSPTGYGRIWVFWMNNSGWQATRSNKAVTKFEPITTIKVPANVESRGHVACNGARGPLEAVATYTNSKGSDGVYARQILPQLSVSAPASVTRGKTLAVRVTDAGDPVKGAVVHFDGATAKTNSHGVADLKVAKHAKTGKKAVTVTDAGYAAASTTAKVK